MRVLIITLSCLALSAQAGEFSPGNDRNNDGGPRGIAGSSGTHGATTARVTATLSASPATTFHPHRDIRGDPTTNAARPL